LLKKLKMVYAHSIRKYLSFIFHMLIGVGKDMTCMDFRFTRLKVKVTRVLFVKQWFPLFILRDSYHKAIIFHMLIGLGETLFDV